LQRAARPGPLSLTDQKGMREWRVGEPAVAPAPAARLMTVDSAIEALKVDPAVRTTEQRLTVRQASRTFSREQMDLLNRAASPSVLSLADQKGLRDLRSANASVESSVRRSTPRGTPLAVLQKLLECIG